MRWELLEVHTQSMHLRGIGLLSTFLPQNPLRVCCSFLWTHDISRITVVDLVLAEAATTPLATLTATVAVFRNLKL